MRHKLEKDKVMTTILIKTRMPACCTQRWERGCFQVVHGTARGPNRRSWLGHHAIVSSRSLDAGYPTPALPRIRLRTALAPGAAPGMERLSRRARSVGLRHLSSLVCNCGSLGSRLQFVTFTVYCKSIGWMARWSSSEQSLVAFSG